ncbi:hypothetical protein N9901_00950 [Flavobacteriaceae bacterium]|nr:hypothetical protein [Flavobacteriaceae bacterium]
MDNKRYRRRRKSRRVSSKQKNDGAIYTAFLGSIFICMGVIVGDLEFNTVSINSYVPILLGLSFLAIAFSIFVKQKRLNTSYNG